MTFVINRGELQLNVSELSEFQLNLSRLYSEIHGRSEVPWRLFSVDQSSKAPAVTLTTSSEAHDSPSVDGLGRRASAVRSSDFSDLDSPSRKRRERTQPQPPTSKPQTDHPPQPTTSHVTPNKQPTTSHVTPNNQQQVASNQQATRPASWPANYPATWPASCPTPDYHPDSTLHKRLNPSPTHLLSLPDWSRTFHKLISDVCYHPSGQLFVTRVLDHDEQTKFNEAMNALTIRTFEDILGKLLGNGYKSTTEAFSELYMVLHCSFMLHEPGSKPWMNVQDVVNLVHSVRVSLGLQDGGRGLPVNLGLQDGLGGGSVALGISVEEFEEELRRLSSGAYGAEDKPVSEEERLEFQESLLGLDHETHLELFTLFEQSASWRRVNGNEVELDDQATQPQVFRSMMKWASDRLRSRPNGVLHDSSQPGSLNSTV